MFAFPIALMLLAQTPSAGATSQADADRFKPGTKITTYLPSEQAQTMAYSNLEAYLLFVAASKDRSLKGLQAAAKAGEAASVRNGHEIEVVAYHELQGSPIKAPVVEAKFLDSVLKGKTYWFAAQYLRAEGTPLLPGEFSLPLFALELDKEHKAEPGDRLELTADTGTSVFVAKDLFAYGDFIKSARAKDQAGIQKQLESKRLATVDPGTKLLVLKRHDNQFIGEGIPAIEGRILDGILKDASVWVPEFSTQSYKTVIVRDSMASSKSSGKRKRK